MVEPTVSATKRCTKCKEEHPVTEFWRDPKCPDGRSRWCNHCRRKRVQEFRAVDPEWGKRKYQREKKWALAHQLALIAPPDHRRCCVCKALKNRDDFWHSKMTKDGLARECKECMTVRNKKSAIKHAVKRRALHRNYNLKKLYNITADRFDEMVQEQEGKCAICSDDITNSGKNPCVDHNHKTGNVRSILCQNCNFAIGGFKEDVNILNSAIEYLDKWRDL
jgi:Recombination endonuclease VII